MYHWNSCYACELPSSLIAKGNSTERGKKSYVGKCGWITLFLLTSGHQCQFSANKNLWFHVQWRRKLYSVKNSSTMIQHSLQHSCEAIRGPALWLESWALLLHGLLCAMLLCPTRLFIFYQSALACAGVLLGDIFSISAQPWRCSLHFLVEREGALPEAEGIYLVHTQNSLLLFHESSFLRQRRFQIFAGFNWSKSHCPDWSKWSCSGWSMMMLMGT